MNTEKLYYKDSHMAKFHATVLECRQEKKGWAVILDKTAFFPEGGGQAADTGAIGGARVLDVQETEGEILHYCDSALTIGQVVDCALDYEQRLSRMQNHSGEHIFSGIAHKLYGCENVGFHMGEDCMTIDFDRELDFSQLQEVETRTNEAVRANLPVKTYFPESHELNNMEYRSKLDLTENVRIVDIEGVDRCACCAPHVSFTGEIGLIKLLDFERHRGGVRLSLVCGMAALADCRMKQENITAISQALSVKRQDTAAAVERMLSEQQKSKERIAALSMALVQERARGYAETAGNICIFDNVLDEIALRELVNLLMEKSGGMVAVFSGTDETGYRYIMGSLHQDLRAKAREINAIINGRGGGRPQMIQGSAQATREHIIQMLEK